VQSVEKAVYVVYRLVSQAKIGPPGSRVSARYKYVSTAGNRFTRRGGRDYTVQYMGIAGQK
jgi:hypothetical protein